MSIFKYSINTVLEISAPPPQVWRVLTDFPSYPTWSPFVREIDGVATEGARIRAVIGPIGKRPSTFTPLLLRVDANRELRWKGRVLAPGVFDAEHFFVLRPSGDGTLLTHGENFSGLLVPFFKGFLDETRASFVAMNEALARRTSTTAASGSGLTPIA